jgi:hypothetical protein
MSREIDPVLEGLTEQQLKDLIVNNVREVVRMREDAKVYAKASREAVKTLEDRNKEALELLELKKGGGV